MGRTKQTARPSLSQLPDTAPPKKVIKKASEVKKKNHSKDSPIDLVTEVTFLVQEASKKRNPILMKRKLTIPSRFKGKEAVEKFIKSMDSLAEKEFKGLRESIVEDELCIEASKDFYYSSINC